MPVGMIELLVSAIFAATMSSMDAELNKSADVFVKDFSPPQFSPGATDRQLLRVGIIATLVLGDVLIAVAPWMNSRQELGLFLLMERITSLVAVSVTVPLLLGLIVVRTPPWSAWSTVAVGFVSSLFITQRLTPEWAAAFFGLGHALSPTAAEYWRQAAELFGNVGICSLWFIGTKLFWSRTSPAMRAQVDEFFLKLNRPVDFAREEGADAANDSRQSRVVGWLCVAYGAFVCLLALIPNPLVGRLAFIGCGAVVLSIGLLLLGSARRAARHLPAA